MIRSLRPRTLTQFLLAFGLALALPLLAYAAFATLRLALAERAQITGLADERGREALVALEREVASQVASLTALARASALDEADHGDFYNQALGLSAIQGAHVMLRELDGRQVFNTRAPLGTMLATIPLGPADRRVVATRAPAISDVVPNPVTGEPCVLVTIPIMRGEAVGRLLSAVVGLDRLSGLIAARPWPEGYSATYVDRAGLVVGRASRDGFVGSSRLPGFDGLAGEEGRWTGIGLAGTSVTGFYRRSADTGFTVAIGVPTNTLEAPLRRSLTLLGGLGLGLGALGLGLALRFSRTLAAAFERLSGFAAGLARGEALPEGAAYPVREAEIVSRALAKSAWDLRAREAELAEARRALEARVEARTRELAEQGRMLAATLDSMDQGLVMIDAAGIVAIANRRAADLLDVDPSLLAARPHYTEIRRLKASAGEYAAATPEFQAWIASGAIEPAEATYERTRPDGTVLEVHSTPLPDGGMVRTYTDITARRRAETALRAKTALLDATLENMDQGLMMVDGEGLVQVCNERAMALLDLPPALMRARPSFDEVRRHQLAEGEFASADEQLRSLVVTPGLSRELHTYERERPNGTVLEIRTVPLSDGGAVRTYADMTARKRAEALVAESEARYRALADALPLLVWVMRPSDGEAVYVNARFRDYYGPIGSDRPARVAQNHPDDAERVARAWEASRAEARTFDVECRFRRRDGAYRWHKLVMVPSRRDGLVVEWIGTALDIDDIVTAREALRETTDLLRLAQEAAGAGTWDWDLRSGLVRMSPESARMHGLARTEGDAENGVTLTFHAYAALLAPEAAGRASEAMRRAVDARSTFSVEVRPEGTAAAWILGLGRVLFDAADRPTRIVGLHLDITERKAAEASLAAAKEEAERASAAKSDFLASMSHEIRTPLGGVLGYADLLLEDPSLSLGQRRHAEHIQAAGSALLTVVDDVLDFSAIEAGRVVLAPRRFSPAELAESALAIVRGLAQRKGLLLEADLAPDLPAEVIGDADRLRQVLLNLLNNAVKFTARGRVGLTLAPGPAGPGLHGLAFAVTDTGIGIAPDKRDRLFQRFSQVDGSIRREYGGTGLGLAISQRLVGLMGGTVALESEPGRGSTFSFSLAFPAAPATDAAGASDAVPPPDRPARVLVVDDVAVNQALARAVLEGAGHAVDVAGDGAEALRAVQARAYDLVLMDVQMPGMDGLTATRRIRALDHAARDLPIVAMTANVLPAQVQAFREAGMNDHLGKPFRKPQLLDVVRRWAPAPER